MACRLADILIGKTTPLPAAEDLTGMERVQTRTKKDASVAMRATESGIVDKEMSWIGSMNLTENRNL